MDFYADGMGLYYFDGNCFFQQGHQKEGK